MLSDVELEQENARARISQSGPGAEFVRDRIVIRLQQRMAALYAHGSLPDLVLLEDALRVYEDVQGSPGSALLTETLREILGSFSGNG